MSSPKHSVVLVVAVLAACGEPEPSGPCERVSERVTATVEGRSEQALAPITVGQGPPGRLFVSWQGEDGPTACEPRPDSECAPPADTCPLPPLRAAVGERAVLELFVVNISSGTLELFLVDFSYDSCSDLAIERFEQVLLPPDAVTSVDVVFTPTEPGPCEGRIELYTNGLNVDRGFPVLVSVQADGVEGP